MPPNSSRAAASGRFCCDGVMGAPAEDRTIMLNALRGLTRAFSDVTAERNSARRDAQRKAKAE